MSTRHNIDIENIEIELLLEAIYKKYGYDFRLYSRASLKRRIMHRVALAGLDSVSSLQQRILYNINALETLLTDLSINVTEMFRDPFFYEALRKDVIPVLKTYPFIKIWHAGVASGEEVYSLAIILKEEGLYEKSQIYATDFNEIILHKARQGIIPLDQIKNYTLNYQKAGGKESFADYYTAKYDSAMIDQTLKKNIVFADHNLATDGVFGEMNLILCRNVLIYFQRDLQNRVIRLFRESLCHLGFLCLGTKETLMFTDDVANFKTISEKAKIYKKIS